MEPYTIEDRYQDKQKALAIAERSCRFCGFYDIGIQSASACEIDLEHRDCEGKCSRYVSRKAKIKRNSITLASGEWCYTED